MAPERPLLYIPDAAVRRILSPARAVELAEQALLAQARGEVRWAEPRLLTLGDPAHGRRFMAKGCLFEPAGEGGVRALLVDRDDPAPRHDGPPTKLLLLYDAQAGRFVAIIDEEWQHAVRTGAGVAVAARHLAAAGAQRLALIGAGWVAGPTVEALRCVLPLEEVRVCSRRAASRERLCEQLGGPARPVASVAEAVRGATLVVTATTATEPLVRADWLDPGVFVYAMGDHQELAADVYRQADRVLADDWEQCQTRADIRRLVGEGVIEPGRVDSLWEVAGGLRPGRVSPEERIVLRSQGLATQDVAIGALVYAEASRLGLGIRLE